METITIVALIALPEEHRVFQEIFPYKADHSSQTQICLEHNSGSDDIRLISILAQEMGAQSAGESASFAITEFNPDLVVVVGIAGGVSNDVSIGDVCVSNEIVDVLHNNKISDKAGNSDIAFAPNFYSIDAELIASFAFLNAHPNFASAFEGWQTSAISQIQGNDDIKIELQDYKPKIEIGPIACGPVSASPQFNEKIKSLHRKVTAIETESGGVFQRITTARIPAIAIRGISDMADQEKAGLEKRTKGLARRLAMFNATSLLKVQLSNTRFIDVARAHLYNKKQLDLSLFPAAKVQSNIVAELENEISARLKDLSLDFKARPDGFYLPIPRARRISYTDELSGRTVSDPEGIIDCIKQHNRSIVRLPRAFPSQALGWSLAHSLLRQQIDGKVILPFVVSGSSIRPPQAGLDKAVPHGYDRIVKNPEFVQVFIIEEPSFESRTRMKYLSEQLDLTSAKILILTKSEDNVAVVDDFIHENGLVEFELSPVSFSETAFFLERAFDMNAREAEAVAIRLDDTFRKFRLDADPTYFAGLQEDTLAALINANKRAELIQLAVDGLLTLSVAADKADTRLSRTIREKFLKLLTLKMAQGVIRDSDLSDFATGFLIEYAFDVPQSEFLSPFFQIGLLYQCDGQIKFTHPYLESYLLAQALREFPDLARSFFRPDATHFNHYTFDLYCELGPDDQVISNIVDYSKDALERAKSIFTDRNIYLKGGQVLTVLSSPAQLQYLAAGLMKNAERMERPNANDDVRAEKQQLLDARRKVKDEVTSRDITRNDNLPAEIKTEFQVLDELSRSLSLCVTAIGAGSEALDRKTKEGLADLLLQIADKFSDVWTRNRLRIDFRQAREDLLTDENIWKFIEDIGADRDDFAKIKEDIQIYLHGVEFNTILEPMGRVLWRLSSNAGVKVLEPVLKSLNVSDPLQKVIRGCWYMDVDPNQGSHILKAALSDYSGSNMLRLVLASHLLGRVFWHHYKTASSDHFVSSARRALKPLDLKPTAERLEQVQQGVTGTGTPTKKKKKQRKKSSKRLKKTRHI